jgi:hypothetical protein
MLILVQYGNFRPCSCIYGTVKGKNLENEPGLITGIVFYFVGGGEGVMSGTVLYRGTGTVPYCTVSKILSFISTLPVVSEF